MADTSFTAQVTVIAASWLNQINKLVFWGRKPGYATTTGSANAQVLTLETGSLYVTGSEADGDSFSFTAGFTNSSTTTLQIKNPSGTNTARAVQLGGVALSGGEIIAGNTYIVTRLGTTWQLTSLAGTAIGLSLLQAATAAAIRTISGALQDTANVITAKYLAGSTMGFSLINGTIVPSQNGTVLTVAIKTLAGGDPSATDPVYVLFRNATAGTGDYTVITLTAATSIATTVAGTFGVANNVPFKLWIVGFNDGGTFRLALISCLTTVAGSGAGRDVTSIYPLGQFPVASAIQIGAGSTSSGVFYSFGAAVTSKAYAILGYLIYESGLATAGTFGVNQSRTHLQKFTDPIPGQIIQIQRNDTGAVSTGTTAIPQDDTIPQITEGDQYMTQVITPTSATNALRIVSSICLSNSNASQNLMAALFFDATANAYAAEIDLQATATGTLKLTINKMILAAGTAATTARIRAGAGTGATTTFNGGSGARLLGGVINSSIQVEEIMT